jgi:hypothetical protein
MIVRIAIFCYFMNAGGTMRAIEIARGIHDEFRAKSSSDSLDLRIFSNRGPPQTSYEQYVRDAGLAVELCEPEVDNEMWAAFLRAEKTGQGFFPPPYQDRAAVHIRGIMNALLRFQPTLVVHGLFPEAMIAAKILNFPTVCFSPLPMSRDWIAKQQASFLAATGKMPSAAHKDPTKSTLYRAAVECGWPSDPASMQQLYSGADETLVCDLESNYSAEEQAALGPNTYITGPVFAHSSQQLPAKIFSVISSTSKRNKVFFTMASSADRSFIQPTVEALCREPGEFCGVISVAPNICSLDELQLQKYQDSADQSVIITNEFLPFDKIASMVNVVLMHGGQGTVQSALAAGVPIVGVAMQFEQNFNLANVERRGAGIHLSQESWTADNIHAALKRVLGDPFFERAAQRVKAEMGVVDGSRNAAARIVNFAKAHSQ